MTEVEQKVMYVGANGRIYSTQQEAKASILSDRLKGVILHGLCDIDSIYEKDQAESKCLVEDDGFTKTKAYKSMAHIISYEVTFFSHDLAEELIEVFERHILEGKS
jgi:hypothetical protein